MASYRILVIGAGELGTAVLNALTKKNSDITLLLRPSTINAPSPARARELESLRTSGVNLLGCDLSNSNQEDLVAIFREFDAIISCTGYSGGGGVQKKLAQSVIAARVLRYVPWQFGVDYDIIGRGAAQELFDEQLDVRDILRSQNSTSWVIISTGIFMSFFLAPAWGILDPGNETVRAFANWKNTFTVTTAEDIGVLTAEIIHREPQIKNEVVFIAGDTLSYEQVAGIADRVYGKKFHRELWSYEQLEHELHADPQNVLCKYRMIWAEGKGVAWDLDSTFNHKIGVKTTSLEEYLQDGPNKIE